MSERCPACQSERLEETQIVSAAAQPARAGLLAKALAGAAITARACIDCGHLDRFRADAARLRAMLGVD